jgi:chromosomal replication initiation ATPase DnaA
VPDNPAAARQLALPFDEPDQFAAADLIEAASNLAARAALDVPESWVNGRLVLWGEAGCGKSLLAHLWGAAHKATIIAASRLREPLSSPGAAIVVEDIDAMAAPIALFATLERATAAGQPVLMTSRIPPARLTIALADLASRLRASLTIQIEPAEPALLEALLVRLAAARQMTLSPSVHQFLLNRLPRRPAIMREAVARLDRYALALGSAPSRRIAERLLGELTDLPEDDQATKQTTRHTEIHETDTPSLL